MDWARSVLQDRPDRLLPGRRLERIRGRGISGNHIDTETGEEFWVSGVRKNGQDRHWAEGGPVEFDADALDEYNRLIGL